MDRRGEEGRGKVRPGMEGRGEASTFEGRGMRLTIPYTKDDVDYEVVCEYHYDNGKYSGSPENCYPEEETFDVVSVNLDGVKVEVRFTEADMDAMIEKAREEAASEREEAEESNAENRKDARRERLDLGEDSE